MRKTKYRKLVIPKRLKETERRKKMKTIYRVTIVHTKVIDGLESEINSKIRYLERNYRDLKVKEIVHETNRIYKEVPTRFGQATACEVSYIAYIHYTYMEDSE